MAPLISVAISMTWGINALLLTAVPIYVLAAVALPQAAAGAEPPRA
jgi:hypothetical protein